MEHYRLVEWQLRQIISLNGCRQAVGARINVPGDDDVAIGDDAVDRIQRVGPVSLGERPA